MTQSKLIAVPSNFNEILKIHANQFRGQLRSRLEAYGFTRDSLTHMEFAQILSSLTDVQN